MGLDDLYPFKPEEKIIEYMLASSEGKKLVDLSLAGFTDETSAETPAPGGGSVSAAMGAMGIALGTMVANLSSHKRGWDERWAEFSDWAEKGRKYQDELIFLVDEDTRSFNAVMDAFSLPRKTGEEKKAREAAIQQATRYATEVPLRVMETAFNSLEVIRAMVEKGIPGSVTDAAVGALAIRSCVMGAYLNVKINARDLDDRNIAEDMMAKAEGIRESTLRAEKEIIESVNKKIG
jgi:glutamate formiminotransferase / formiminotetrahydrofolate cyclodeaminase